MSEEGIRATMNDYVDDRTSEGAKKELKDELDRL